MNLWPHQQRFVDALPGLLSEYKRILCAAPTGAGKGLCIEKALESGKRAILYTDRRLLLDQTAQRLREAGFDFGIRASGMPLSVLAPIQLAMIQTEDSKILKSDQREHFNAQLVILDEAHRLNGPTVQTFRDLHLADGATILGFTATPLDLGDAYDHLSVLATNSECRSCGAHVPAQTYAPDEPDLKGIKRMATGDYEVGALSKLYRRPVIFGRVMENWKRLNAECRPTMLFGPDVAGSRWFCEQFNAHGIPAGHIDGDGVNIRGEEMPSTQETRQQLHDALKCGDIQIVCNRFVLREGVDWPWVSCLVFATAFGSLTSYLQSGGRGLRSAPGKSDVLIIDHGGNWHRHGSLNADREWRLDGSDRIMTKDREERMRNKNETGEKEPIVCPSCAKVRSAGNQCPYCGHMSGGKTRMVVQMDGSLKQMRGDIYRPRRVSTDPADVKAWKQCYFRCKNAKRPMTFNQAAALFARENQGKYPDPHWPLMPVANATKYRKIKDVPMSDLHGTSDRGAA